MKAIHGIWKNGQVVPAQPVDWPDGTTLSIAPIENLRAEETEGDLSGEDDASIARRVAYYEALPPLRMSAGEEAEWQVASAFCSPGGATASSQGRKPLG
jgi:hypothetical protein